ncbi:MAG: hypothetical protein KBS63_03505 [Clostridiales bacterium]|nr:hypothetical protein [Candidatus Crickella caballi]
MIDDSIKVMSLLDELEEMFATSSKVPFSEKGVVDIDMAQKIIEDIRLSLPKDLQQAQWIKQEKDRIINDAKTEYNKVIMSAKDQAEYLVDSDMIKKEAQKRADAVLNQAKSEAEFMKLRTYEYIDKLLFDMQNDIAGVASSYLQPMNDYLTDMLGSINVKVNQNRQEMKNLAERVQNSGAENTEE